MAQRPKSVSFDEARRVPEAYGSVLDRVHGSHHMFAQGSRTLSIPLRRPHIKPAYVKQILQLTEGQDDDDGDSA